MTCVGGDYSEEAVWSMPSSVEATHMAKPWLLGIASPSLATFAGDSGFQQIYPNLLVVIVPSIRDESACILSMLFHVNWQNFDS